MEINKIYCGKAREVLETFPDQSVNCCVTSPPYWGLRDYGVDDQLGMEKTPEEYIERLVGIMREVRRVLRDDGTLWLNLGDTYSGAGWRNNNDKPGVKQKTNKGTNISGLKIETYCKPKDLVGIPWMVAFALRADGWYLRQDIIWNKPNPMPESVTDRCTKAHEYIFLLSKSLKYYYDNEAIKTPLAEGSYERSLRGVSESNKWATGAPGSTAHAMNRPRKNVRFGGQKGVNYDPQPGDPNYRNGSHQAGREYVPSANGMANKKSVWTVSTKPFKEAHFAVFPQELIVDCIKAGCPEDGVVLDTFAGSGTTPLVSRKLHRNYVGIDLNPKFVDMADKRLITELGLFV